MLQRLRNSITHLLIIAILISSMGMVINEKYCPVKGKNSISVLKQHTCCCSSDQEKKQKDNCCKLIEQFVAPDLSSDTVYSFSFIQDLLPAVKHFVLFEFNNSLLTVFQAVKPSNTSPPQPYGRTVTILYQVFII